MPYLSSTAPVKPLRAPAPIPVLLLLFGALAAVGLGLGLRTWASRPPPRGVPVEQALSELHPSEPFVRVEGMAHYPVVVTQHIPGNLFVDEKTWYLFPLFPRGEVEDRAIRVLVRTQRAPERLVSYEELTLEGRVLPLTEAEVPFETEMHFGSKGGYFFHEGVVLLEPWRIEAPGEPPWEAPEG